MLGNLGEVGHHCVWQIQVLSISILAVSQLTLFDWLLTISALKYFSKIALITDFSLSGEIKKAKSKKGI
jgi:hypothetical protein